MNKLRSIPIDDLIKQADASSNQGQQNSVTNTISKGIDLADSGNKSDMQIEQTDHPLKLHKPFVKAASLEILLSNISVDANIGATVKPSNCPAVARVQDYGKDNEQKPACVFRGKNCPYFEKAGFILEDFYKLIICNFSKG